MLLEDDAEGCFVLGAAADHQFVAGLEDVQREAPAGEEDHAEGEERNASSFHATGDIVTQVIVVAHRGEMPASWPQPRLCAL